MKNLSRFYLYTPQRLQKTWLTFNTILKWTQGRRSVRTQETGDAGKLTFLGTLVLMNFMILLTL